MDVYFVLIGIVVVIVLGVSLVVFREKLMFWKADIDEEWRKLDAYMRSAPRPVFILSERRGMKNTTRHVRKTFEQKGQLPGIGGNTESLCGVGLSRGKDLGPINGDYLKTVLAGEGRDSICPICREELKLALTNESQPGGGEW